MKVCDLVKMLNLTVFCGEEGLDTEITGGYTSDLLSDVMGHIEEGMLWITMQTHQNILAVADLVKMLNLTVFCGEEGLDTEITGGYTSDLLSDVMGHIEEGMLWITMQTHQNILAVATLKDASAVLIVNGTSPDDETLQKGREEAVPLLGTTRSAFEASGMIYRLLQNENG